MTFVKGNKLGNRFNSENQPEKNGRLPKLPNLDRLLGEVLGKEDENGITEAQKILQKLAKQAQDGNVRASEIILDRGYGKPKQFVENTNLNMNSDLTEDQLNDKIERLLNKSAEDDSDTGTN